MKRSIFNSTRNIVLVLLAFALAPLGCAQQVGDIDRTQPGLIDKDVFEGEWFMRRTVIDVPYDAGYTFIGETEEVIRIRWDIQENHLVALRAHPLIAGTTDAAPIAVFEIEDHVDVNREYNSSTGEQSNVIVENTEDNMWYERSHLRVDWSTNHVKNFHFYVDELEQDSVAVTIEDENDPNHPILGVKNDDGSWTDYSDPAEIRGLESAQYIDVVTKIFVKPETFLVEDWDGNLFYEPACWYYLNYDCVTAIVSIRNSFVRVDAAVSDYEPLEYPDNQLVRNADGDAIHVRWNADGDRESYDPDSDGGSDGGDKSTGAGDGPQDPYGLGGDNSLVRMEMFDKFGYFRVERYGYDPDYGEVESNRIYLINRWNIWQQTRGDDGNLIPFPEREVRPIVYYLSPGFPDSLLPTANHLVKQWNDALQETVTSLTGRADIPDVFELRPNTRSVNAETGEVLVRGEVIGDLRYSHLYLVDEPTRAGLLGYGPSAIDLMTGEIFAADAYIYGATVREVAAKGRDIVDLINGRIDPQEFALGENVQALLAKLKMGGTSQASPSKEALDKFVASRPNDKPKNPMAGMKKGPARMPSPHSVHKIPGIDKLKRPAGWTHSRLQNIKDKPIEDLLMASPELRILKGMGMVTPQNASQPLPPGLHSQVSPTHWASPLHRREVVNRFRSYAMRNMMMASFFDDAVAGLALELKDTPSDEILDELVSHIFRATAEHEVGHTLGLRHNFEASTDALNYHEGYWDLRGENPEPMANLGQAEKNGKLREYQYSSIMDYAGRFNADIQGIGRYDRAAIKFGYGQLVEVFDNAPNDPLLELQDYDGDYYDRPFSLRDIFRDLRHYTRIPGIMGGVDNIGKRTNVPYTPDVAELMGQDAHTSYMSQHTGDAPWSYWEVPYRYCSDEYTFGTKTCHAYDMGADSYEIVADAIDRYWNYYWFNNFKRDRVFFDEWDYMDRMWYRYFHFVHNAYQHWVFDDWFLGSTVWESLRWDGAESWGIEDEEWSKALDGGLTQAAASMQGFKFLQQVLAIPEPGAYWYDFDYDYYWAFESQSLPICEEEWSMFTSEYCSDVNFELGDGRYLYSIYDWESGYYFYERLKWVGTFYDKILALEVMTNPDTYILGVQSAESIDEWAISMNLRFPDEIQKVFGGIAADRFDLFGGVIEEEFFSYVPPDPFATDSDGEMFATYSPVDPYTSFTIQLYALWYGMAWLNANFDNSFNDYAKIWLQGSGEGLESSTPENVIQFSNPYNGRIYVAVQPSDMSNTKLGVGALMLGKANEYLDMIAESQAAIEASEDADEIDYYEYLISDLEWQIQNITENIEVVRGLHELYGKLYF